MASSVTVDIFVSVDGWAGSDGLPGYFGYLGPELQEWIMDELAAPQLVVMGRRTYQALAALPAGTGQLVKTFHVPEPGHRCPASGS
jgi:dihydrofolate reductase